MAMTSRRVAHSDVVDFLSSRTMAPSNMGSQLDKLRDGYLPTGDTKRAQERMEATLLQQAAIVSCVDGLLRQKSIRWVWATDMRRFAQRSGQTDGEACVGIMRAFAPWSSQWPEKALACVYEWAATCDTGLSPIKLGGECDPGQAFRTGKDPKARNYASALVSDASVVLADWVAKWNAAASRKGDHGES